MTNPDTAKLRDLAAEAFEKGRMEQALAHFVELERREGLPGWAKWSANACQRLGRIPEAVAAFNRAAREYLRAGELIKAAAACKQALQLDPKNAEATKRISELRGANVPTQPQAPAQRFPPTGTRPSFDRGPSGALEALRFPDLTPGSATSPPRAVQQVAKPVQLPQPAQPARPAHPGQQGQQAHQGRQSTSSALEAIRLTDVVPGAAPAKGRSTPSGGIYRIPLPDELDDDQPLELSLSGLEAGDSDNEDTDEDISVDADGNVVSGKAHPARSPAPARPTEDSLIAAIEAEVRVAERANEALMRTPFFTALGPRSFGELLMDATLVNLQKGKTLFKQGDPGDALYVIAEGKVEVIDEGPPRRQVALLQDGDFFGEIALVADQPRNATVIAMEDTQLISIGRDVVQKLANGDPNFIPGILRFLRDRLFNRLVSTNPLFKGLTPADRQSLKLRFRFLEIDPGTVLLEQGKKPDGLLVLLAGRAEVVRLQDGKNIKLATLGGGDVIGEIALVSQAFPKDALGGRLRRRALHDVDLFTSIGTFTTLTKCFALELPADDFIKIVHADGIAFIRGVIEQRAAHVKAILSGATPYSEGRLKL